jgi:hypothetical protein
MPGESSCNRCLEREGTASVDVRAPARRCVARHGHHRHAAVRVHKCNLVVMSERRRQTRQMRTQTKYSSIRSAQETPSDRYEVIAEKLEQLARVSDGQYAALARSLRLSGQVRSVDMLLMSVVSRSMEIIESFLGAIDTWNVSVASALVRLQIDNVMRCHLFAVTPDADGLLLHLMADKRLRDLELPVSLIARLPVEDRRRAKRHQDWVLVALASQEHEWIEGAYDVSSAWIHHSAAHLLTSYEMSPAGHFAGRVPVEIEQFDEEFLLGLVNVMGVSSRTVVRYLDEWTATKLKSQSSDDCAAEVPD